MIFEEDGAGVARPFVINMDCGCSISTEIKIKPKRHNESLESFVDRVRKARQEEHKKVSPLCRQSFRLSAADLEACGFDKEEQEQWRKRQGWKGSSK